MPATPRPPVRPLNDPAQYDDLAGEWWQPRGRFAMLHWISAARARLVPPAPPGGGLLVDLACGAGLLAPHVAGYRHVGLDLSLPALTQARAHGVVPVRADVTRLPLRDQVADVVVAGEILEHVRRPGELVREACRVLRPGGTLVVDTIARTWWGRFSAVTVGERIPAGPPRRLHDPALFVDRDELVRAAAEGGVDLALTGLRPSARHYLGWLLRRREDVTMRPTRSTAGLFQASGVKRATPNPPAGPAPAVQETAP